MHVHVTVCLIICFRSVQVFSTNNQRVLDFSKSNRLKQFEQQFLAHNSMFNYRKGLIPEPFESA